ncbi:hypothetical protein [Micromonospora sp. CB01531]|uniref:hypothetical protein n=1 Tax=Micromonospora sp. CB01531 TaxID=1718947 RepID=UPI001A7E19A9|nr:hypothetical protein [Micromonospora sp. CB01531]
MERFAHATVQLERVIEHSRGLARRSAMALQYNEPIPPDLSVGVGHLADAVELLRHEHRAGRPTERTHQKIRDAVQKAGRARALGVNDFGDAVVTQLRTAASDLLRAIGCNPTSANQEVRRAMRDGEESAQAEDRPD